MVLLAACPSNEVTRVLTMSRYMGYKWYVAIPLVLLVVVLLSLGTPTPAEALSCSATVTNVDFGSPDLLSNSPTDALATITVSCTALPSHEVVKMCPSIDDGTGGSAGQVRFMRGDGHQLSLAYGLYEDASHAVSWGSQTNPQLGSVPAIILSSTTGTAIATRTLYGRLFGAQTAFAPDMYRSDFEGAEAPFTWSPYFLEATGTCTRFEGLHVIHPSFEVVAHPGPSCKLTAANLTFPNAGALVNGVSGQAEVGVTCTHLSPYSISLDNGQNGTSPTARHMKSAQSATVIYGLFRDNAHTLVWGNAASGQAVSAVGTGTAQGFIVYGFVPPQNTPAPATYTDRIVVTVTY